MMRALSVFFVVLFLATLVRGETVTVSAAVSLKEALTEIGKTYEAQTADHVDFNFAASGPLAAQIQQGAPVDAFISAANKQVDELVKGGLVDAKTRQIVARNELVLIVPASAENPPHSFTDLASQKVTKIAVGQPQSVPAGQYASQTLASLKLTEALAGKIVYGSNVRQVLDYVQRNEVDAGVVYATDAKQAGESVKVVTSADPATHEPIVYPAVVITGSAHAAAAERFLRYLMSPPAQAVLTAKGFLLPLADPTTLPAP